MIEAETLLCRAVLVSVSDMRSHINQVEKNGTFQKRAKVVDSFPSYTAGSLDVGVIGHLEQSAQVGGVSSKELPLRQLQRPFVDALSLKYPYVPRALGLEQSPVELSVQRC